MSALTWRPGHHEAGRLALSYAARAVQQPGVMWGMPGGELAVAASILAEAATLATAIPQSRKVALVRKAIARARKGGQALNEGGFLKHLSEVQREYLDRPDRSFVLLTSLSIRGGEALGHLRPRGASIMFSRQPPPSFADPEVTVGPRRRLPNGYTSVRVRVTSPLMEGAAELALERLDYLRGLWAFASTFRRWTIKLGPDPGPLGPIRLGPIHTLHEPSGVLIDVGHWYEPAHSYVEAPFNPPARAWLHKLRQTDRELRATINRMSMAVSVENLFVRYARALDDPDHDGAFLRLWSVLEEATGARKQSNEVVARRASFVLRDAQYNRIQLVHLAKARNESVHRGMDVPDSIAFAQSLKSYVDSVLNALLDHGHGFDSLQEWGEFLGLPPHKAELERRRDHYQRGIDFRFP